MYQLIIFDVDGTFYNLEDVVLSNYNMQTDFFVSKTGLSRAIVERIFKENSIFPYKSEKAKSATEFFLKNGISADAWREYRDAHTSPECICRETSVSNRLLTQYMDLAQIVLLSSNSEGNIQRTLDWLEIDADIFDAVFCSTSRVHGLENQLFSKKAMVSIILDKYGLEPKAVLSIGDRYASDIKPLVDLGGDGVLIHIPEELKEVYHDLFYQELGKKENTSYKFFTNTKIDL